MSEFRRCLIEFLMELRAALDQISCNCEEFLHYSASVVGVKVFPVSLLVAKCLKGFVCTNKVTMAMTTTLL